MDPHIFAQKIETACQRLAALRQQGSGSAPEQALRDDILEEVTAGLEELHVAAEELLQGNEELATTQQVIAAERERYRALFEGAPEGCLVTDTEGTIQEANHSAALLLGLQPPFLVGKPLVVFVIPEDWHLFYGYLTRSQPSSPDATHSQELQVRLQPRGRAGFPAILTVGSFLDAANRMAGLRWLLRDSSERQRTGTQLREMQKMEALGTLAGGVVHDFNNFLAGMISHAELATTTVPRENPAWQDLQDVLAIGQRARDLALQLLLFTRQRDQVHQPIALHQVVKEAVRLCRISLPSTIELSLHIDPASGMVLADVTQMHQMLLNLWTNAAYALRGCRGTLEVRVENVEVDAAFALAHPPLAAGSHVRLVVRDTGHGMTPQVQERILEPFFTTKPPGEGTGLGLTVTQGIVANHRGAITVDSAPECGTIFALYFPICHREAADVVATSDPVRGHGERILVVDDDPSLASLWQKMLERVGYRAAACTSGREAVELLREAPTAFDVLITNLAMPGMSGDALAEACLRLRPDLPIILCTGFLNTLIEERAKALGIRAFLRKPLWQRDLSRAVQHVLAQRVAVETF